MLKVSPWKGIFRFGKKGKLAPTYVGTFKILERIGSLTYRLELPTNLSNIHDVFHVSSLKKCLYDESLAIPLEEIRIDKKLNFTEEPMEVTDRMIKKLKRTNIPIVKVRWNSNADRNSNGNVRTARNKYIPICLLKNLSHEVDANFRTKFF